MAYMIFTSAHDRDNLKYRLEGGDPYQPTLELPSVDGNSRKSICLGSCILRSERVPDSLMVSVPRKIIVTPCRDGFIADFGMAANFGTYIVSDRFVDIVERLEPGVHQFLPIAEAVDNRGKPLARRFFLLNVLTRLAAIDVERSTVVWKDNSFEFEGRRIHSIMLTEGGGPINQRRFVARREAIDGHHLWQGNKEGLMGRYFCSNQLHDAMQAEGLSPFQFLPMDES